MTDDRGGEGRADSDVERFRQGFAGSAYHLLEPLTPQVNYAFEVLPADPWTLELSATKWWFGADGRPEHCSVTLNTYEMPDEDDRRDGEREIVLMEREELVRLHREGGLEAAMARAEAMARQHGHLHPDEPLFRAGPPDPFTLEQAEAVFRAFDTPEPGSWGELLAWEAAREPEPETATPYWQFNQRSVVTPEGRPLGYALYCTVYPQLPANFDAEVEAHGFDDSVYPTEARTLEMARFGTQAEADRFERELHGYLLPGVFDGPNIAEEVARLEGLPVEWQDMSWRDITSFMAGHRTVERQAEVWQPSMPQAEREADSSLNLDL